MNKSAEISFGKILNTNSASSNSNSLKISLKSTILYSSKISLINKTFFALINSGSKDDNCSLLYSKKLYSI